MRQANEERSKALTDRFLAARAHIPERAVTPSRTLELDLRPYRTLAVRFGDWGVAGVGRAPSPLT